MRHFSIALFLIFLLGATTFGQRNFILVHGTKADYSILIPPAYSSKEGIGPNIDLKYVDTAGSSIVTVVRDLPASVNDSDLNSLRLLSDKQLAEQYEAGGLINISIIDRGFLELNGVHSFFCYYRDEELYYHAITQFRRGKAINLTYACEYAKKDNYFPVILKVFNSFRPGSPE